MCLRKKNLFRTILRDSINGLLRFTAAAFNFRILSINQVLSNPRNLTLTTSFMRKRSNRKYSRPISISDKPTCHKFDTGLLHYTIQKKTRHFLSHLQSSYCDLLYIFVIASIYCILNTIVITTKRQRHRYLGEKKLSK